MLDENDGAVAQRALLIVKDDQPWRIDLDQAFQPAPETERRQQQVMHQHGKAEGVHVQRQDDADVKTGAQQQQRDPKGPEPEQREEGELKHDDRIANRHLQPLQVQQPAHVQRGLVIGHGGRQPGAHAVPPELRRQLVQTRIEVHQSQRQRQRQGIGQPRRLAERLIAQPRRRITPAPAQIVQR